MVYYTSLNTYLKRRFGGKVYKLSLTSSNSCPNRDGTRGMGGCIFCSEGSSAFRPQYEMPISAQIDEAIKLIKKKTDTDKYIAYFASYTATYGDIDHIEKLFMGAVNDPRIVAVSVATRPDCLGDEVMDLLKRVNAIKPLFVELGLQTASDETAKLINRGSTLDIFNEAIEKLKCENIETVLHIILGLPNETRDMMLDTVRYAVKIGVHGVKLQLLHILKGTKLNEMFERGEVKVLERDEYARLVAECLSLLPEDMVVHRITGDGEKAKLVAPLWSADKKGTLGAIAKYAKPREF